MRYRETEFDVEEGPPSWWHWIIYPGGALPEIIGETMFHRRRPLLLPALKKSIMRLREAETRRKSVQPVNEGAVRRDRAWHENGPSMEGLMAC